MPGYVDTGLNIVHVDDVAAGHLLAAERGRIGERYILGGENLSLAEILAEVAQVDRAGVRRCSKSPTRWCCRSRRGAEADGAAHRARAVRHLGRGAHVA